jgi:hypothetical protein
LREETLDADLVYDPAKLIAPAQRDYDAALPLRRWQCASRGREEAIDFSVRNPVVTACGPPSADRPLVNPLFERRVTDAEPARRRSRCEQVHSF